MILFHAKRDGTVTTTPDLVPQGSSMQDLVVVSEFDYAYCAIKLLPASGEYIEDIPCDLILKGDGTFLWTASLPPKATVVAGSVDYQLIFTAADGATQATLVGSFSVPRGVPVSTPSSVGELSAKTVADLYTILSSLYVAYVGHEHDIYQSIMDIAALKKTVSSAGYVTIPVTEWEDGSPTIATFTLDGFGAGMTAMLIPADSNTQTAAREARLSAYPETFAIDSDTQIVDIIRADADKAPDIPLRFAYLILKTDASVAPTVAILGVDAYGGEGESAGGVDQAAVEAIVKAIVPEWARESIPPAETDPTISGWAKAKDKPTYSKDEVGLGNVDNVRQYSEDNPPPYPVTSVNSKTGAVSLTAGDVGARPENWMPTAADVGARPVSWTPTASDVGADPMGTASAALSLHNVYDGAHNDIRLLIEEHREEVKALLDSDDETLDQLSEIVAYIKSNKSLIDAITTAKVSVTDIINNLTTNVVNKPLSAAQGVALKALVDGLQSGKLDAAALTAAINTALAQAEASGAFKGDKGDKGDSGVYVGSGDMPEGYNVQIDPNGGAIDLYEMLSKKVDKAKVSLGIASDGLVYIFVDGVPVGAGIPQGQGGDVFGYVDENNNVVLTGNLANGTYTIKYEVEDSEGNIKVINIGDMVLDSNVYYSVTESLTNCVNSNTAKTVASGDSYTATITANSGYTLSSVTVTMGGSAVSVTGGTINIASVTGDIVITAVATEVQTNDPDNILTNGAYTVELNKRWSASAKGYNNCNGMICITIPATDALNKTIYFKGFTKDLQASSSKPLWMAFDADLAKVGSAIGDGSGDIWTGKGLTDEGNGVYSYLVNDTNFEKVSSATYLKLNMAVNASAAVTSLDGLTMTIDKPIS